MKFESFYSMNSIPIVGTTAFACGVITAYFAALLHSVIQYNVRLYGTV